MREHEKLFERIKSKGYLQKIKKDLIKLREIYDRDKERVINFLRTVLRKDYIESIEENQPEKLYLVMLAKLSLSEKAGELSLLKYQFERLSSVEKYFSCWRMSVPELLVKTQEALDMLLNHNKPAYERVEPEVKAYKHLEEISQKDEEIEPNLNRKVKYFIQKDADELIDRVMNESIDLESYLPIF